MPKAVSLVMKIFSDMDTVGQLPSLHKTSYVFHKPKVWKYVSGVGDISL